MSADTVLGIAYVIGAALQAGAAMAAEAYSAERNGQNFDVDNVLGWVLSCVAWPVGLPAFAAKVVFGALGRRRLRLDQRLAAENRRMRELLRSEGIEP